MHVKYDSVFPSRFEQFILLFFFKFRIFREQAIFFAMCMSCCICVKSIWYIVLRINEWYDAPIYWMSWNVEIVCIGIDIGMSSFLFVLCFTWMYIVQRKLFWGAFRFYRFHLMLMETLLYTHTHAHAQCVSRARNVSQQFGGYIQ